MHSYHDSNLQFSLRYKTTTNMKSTFASFFVNRDPIIPFLNTNLKLRNEKLCTISLKFRQRENDIKIVRLEENSAPRQRRTCKKASQANFWSIDDTLLTLDHGLLFALHQNLVKRIVGDAMCETLDPFVLLLFGGSWHAVNWVLTLDNLKKSSGN